MPPGRGRPSSWGGCGCGCGWGRPGRARRAGGASDAVQRCRDRRLRGRGGRSRRRWRLRGLLVLAGAAARHRGVLPQLVRVHRGEVRPGAGVPLHQVRDAHATRLHRPAAALGCCSSGGAGGGVVAAMPSAGLVRVAGAAEAFVVGHPDSSQLVVRPRIRGAFVIKTLQTASRLPNSPCLRRAQIVRMDGTLDDCQAKFAHYQCASGPNRLARSGYQPPALNVIEPTQE